MPVPTHGEASTAVNLHRIGVVASSDPGAIGAWKIWTEVDLSDNWVATHERDADDGGWHALASAAGATPAAHATSHENGGSDEISVAGLSGALADPQPTTIAQITDASAYAKTLLDDTDAATARATLGLAIGTNVQAYDAELAALAGLTSAADKGIQFTGSGTAGTFDLTTAGKALIDDPNAAAQRATLGLGTSATLDSDTDGTLAANSDSKLATQKATKTYVDAAVAGATGTYTDEQAQDAVGAMIDASLNYVDSTPLLQRAALTGDVTASAGSNATTIASGAVTGSKIASSVALAGSPTTTTQSPADNSTKIATTAYADAAAAAGTYTNENAQDAVGGILTDSSTIDFTYDDAANTITAIVKTGSIGATELASTAVTPATYGDASNVPQFTVDADGRLTAASNIAITTGAAADDASAILAGQTFGG